MSTQTETITSLTNPRIKAAVRLRDRRERDQTGLTLVDGPRELLRALDHGVAVVEAFMCSDVIRTADAEEAVRRLAIARVARTEVSPTVLAKVAFGDRSDGVVAIVRPPDTRLDALDLAADPLVVVIESVEKPGNLGAILRSADGAGADAVIAADPLTDLYNPNAIRASLGTIFTLPVVAAPAAEVLDWLRATGIRPLTARVDATHEYTDSDLRGPLAIVLGSEAGGLSALWSGEGIEPVQIPMAGAADSLNVSVAAAVLLYEARRQRRDAGGA